MGSTIGHQISILKPTHFLPFIHSTTISQLPNGTTISQLPKYKTSESASPFWSHFLSPSISNSSFYLKSTTWTQPQGLVQSSASLIHTPL